MARHALRDPWLGVPCAGFPLAEVLAIDIAAGRQLWRRPHGTPRELIGLPLNVGAPGMGGPLATAGGLLFIGGAAERVFRAYDVDSGEVLWQHPLPAPGNATPMSYVVTDEDGRRRQFVVIAAGGDRRTGVGGVGDHVVAFALPD